MALGILDLIGLGATLIFALPIGVYGLQRAAEGDPLLGAAFVAAAALMVYLPQRITTPGDVPGKLAERAVGSAVSVPEEERDDDAAADRE